MIPRRSSRTRGKAREDGYKSGLEPKVAAQIDAAGLPVAYEQEKYPYVQERKYCPDFRLPNGVFLEVKGYFEPSDRTKHLLIKKQHPDLDVRFIFSNSKTKLRKSSPTSYADWCVKNNFKFSDKVIPKAWLQEKLQKEQV